MSSRSRPWKPEVEVTRPAGPPALIRIRNLACPDAPGSLLLAGEASGKVTVVAEPNQKCP